MAALGGIHKGDVHVQLDVLAGRIALDGSPAAKAMKDGLEDVAHSAHPAETAETAEPVHAAGATHARMLPLIIVSGALLLIREHLVGLVDLLELFRRERIVGMEIGMVHLDQLFIGRLDLFLGSVFLDAENFVIVFFFCHKSTL